MRPSWLNIVGDTFMHRDIDGPFPYPGDYQGYNATSFESHRYGKNGFQYIFEQPCYNDDHVYEVTMGFAESRDHAPDYCRDGARVFSIQVNGETFVSDLDVHKTSGGCKTAYVLSKEITPKDRKFVMDFIPTVGSPMVAFVDVTIKDRRNLAKGCSGQHGVHSDSISNHILTSFEGPNKKPSWVNIAGATLRHRDHYGPFPYLGDFQGYSASHFESHRFGKSGFKYVFEQPCYDDDHVYEVTMGFAESRDDAPDYCRDGARVFSIQVNGETFASDLDVHKSSGGCRKAYVLSKDFTPIDGKFEMDFIPNVGSPMVAFIEVRVKGFLAKGCALSTWRA